MIQLKIYGVYHLVVSLISIFNKINKKNIYSSIIY